MPKRRNLHEGKSCGPCQRCGDMKCQYYAIQYIGNKSYNREVQGGDVDIKGTNKVVDVKPTVGQGDVNAINRGNIVDQDACALTLTQSVSINIQTQLHTTSVTVTVAVAVTVQLIIHKVLYYSYSIS